MRAKVLLFGGAVAVLASTFEWSEAAATSAAKTVAVSVRVDCLANRGVSFSLVPWSISLNEGDSVYWSLDPASTVDSMSVETSPGKAWPFKRKPPYKSMKGRAQGARDLDASAKSGKYKYAVQAVCLRGSDADTVFIDPDMIIVRGGGT